MTMPQGSPHPYGPVPEKDFPWLIVGIATVLVLVASITGLYLVLSAVTPNPRTPVSGPASTEEPPACDGPCLTIEDARLVAPDADSLALVGSPAAFLPPRSGDEISEYYDETNLAFYEAKGEPRGCSFDLSAAPIIPSSISYFGDDDLAVDYGVWGDESRSLAQIGRVFENPLYADRYRGAISGLIGRCPGYQLTDSAGVVSSFTLTPITIDIAQPDVEAVAWKVDSDTTSRTVVDLRYRELAIRTTFAGSSWTESEIESFLSATAARLAALSD